jgi:hypothetical protein
MGVGLRWISLVAVHAVHVLCVHATAPAVAFGSFSTTYLFSPCSNDFRRHQFLKVLVKPHDKF